jgi:hypothetical protein
MSRFFSRTLAAGVLAAASLAAAPAAQAIQVDPGSGGGCEAWVSDFYKSGSTVIGKLTVACEKKANQIRVAGSLDRTGIGQDYDVRDCYSAYSCTLILGLPDIAGSQRYYLAFDGTANATSVYWGALYGHVVTTGAELRTGYAGTSRLF